MNTSAGILYDVDMRLRPSGDAGLLGCSLQAFENYQLNEAWTWEKQALVRSRAILSETELKAEFEKFAVMYFSAQRDINQLKIEVREMREKMYDHLSHTKDGFLISKPNRGGILILNLLPSI